MAISREVTVRSSVGLHARPAALFVQTASKFSARITVENLARGSKQANARSILSVLAIGVRMNDRIRITAEGADEEAAVTVLVDLVERNFAEAEAE